MGNETSKINSETHNKKLQENTINALFEQEIDDLDHLSKISTYSGDLNFDSNALNEFAANELNKNIVAQPEICEQADNSDQVSVMSDITILGTTPEIILEDKKYHEENFQKGNSNITTQIAKSGTNACLKGAAKLIASKWSFVGAGAIAVYEVSGIYRLYNERKIEGKEFYKHVGRATITTLSCLGAADLGFKAGVGLGILAGVATGGIGIIAAGIIGAFFGGCAGSLLSGVVYDTAIITKSEEELKILSSEELYLKALRKYDSNESTSMDELRKKRKDFIRSYHPDKFLDPGLKDKFSKKLIKYLQFFEIIRIFRKKSD